MQEREKSIFRKASLDSVASPENLNDYIRISSPGVWLVVAAALLLVAAGLVWAMLGSVPETIAAVAVADREAAVYHYAVGDMPESARPGAQRVHCWVPADVADGVHAGDAVVCGPFEGSVSYVFDIPWAFSEIAPLYPNQYMLHELNLGDWSRLVLVDVGQAEAFEDGMYPVTIVTGSQRPIRLLIN